MKRLGAAICLTGIALLIAVQFLMQCVVARHAAYLEWPFDWDQNRYFDYFLFYRQGFTDGGLGGLIQAYRVRPAYSLTLLATSLPLSVFFRGLDFVNLHQFHYVLCLDIGVALIAYRLTRSWGAAVTALAALHFGTLRLLNQCTPEDVIELLRYQVNFPMCSYTVLCVALALEGLYTKRPLGWAVGLALAWGALLLVRPPALPLFAATFLPSVGAALLALAWAGRRRPALIGAAAVALASAIAAVHFYRIWPQALTYYRSATSPPAWQGTVPPLGVILWCFRASSHYSLLALPGLALMLVVAAIRLPRLLRLARGVRRRRWLAVRPVCGFALCVWPIGIQWVTMTLTNLKAEVNAFTLIALTMVLATVALWQLAGALRRRFPRWRPRSPGASRALALGWLAAVLLLCAGSLVYEAREVEAICQGRREDPWAARRDFQKRVHMGVRNYVESWCAKHHRSGAWIGFYGKYVDVNFHNFRVQSYLEGRRREFEIRSYTVPNLKAPLLVELVLVPDVALGKRVFQSLAPRLAAVQEQEAAAYLQEHGYRRIDRIRLDEEVAFDVFQLPKPVPIPDSFEWP